MGLDLDEHDLSEAQRTLKRLGITHVWRPASSPQPLRQDASTASVVFADEPDSTSPSTTQQDKPLAIPPLLRALFHGKQSPVASLWTYHGMYEDMLQAQPPERLTIFRKIQETARTHLNWREQDICSWPLDVAPEVFKAGLDAFAPKLVLCLGNAEEQAALSNFEPARIRHLPALDEMAKGNRDAKNEAWRMLRSITNELFPA